MKIEGADLLVEEALASVEDNRATEESTNTDGKETDEEFEIDLDRALEALESTDRLATMTTESSKSGVLDNIDSEKDTSEHETIKSSLPEEKEELEDPPSEQEEAFRKLEEEKQKMHEQYLRLNADFDNFRKRANREKLDLRRFGHENFVRDLLDGLDNFERAFQTPEGNEANFREGIQMVYRQCLDILVRHGVNRFESKGCAFDYTLHEAISIFETNDTPPDTVYEEFQAGYRLHDKLLRPAKVIVTKKAQKVEEVKAETDASITSVETPSDPVSAVEGLSEKEDGN